MAKKKKKNIKKKKNNRSVKKRKTTKSKKVNKTVKKTQVSKNTKQTKKNYNFNIIYFLIALFIIFGIFYLVYIPPIPKITNVSIDKDNLIISFKIESYKINNKVYCYISDNEEKPNISDEEWFLSKNGKCTKQIDKNTKYYAYLMNASNEIFDVDLSKLCVVNNISVIDNIYIAKNGKEKLDISYDNYGYCNNIKIDYNNYDKSIIDVDSDGVIYGLKDGTTKLDINILNSIKTINITVTSLITTRPKSGYDFNKKYLSCKKYSKEENDLLDDILKSKIETVGYKTRAGVVEAARFLTLDFPYKINYFYENGRQTTNKVDGEGRYYHVGLYLNENKYESIKGSKKGPKMWGCSLYSVPAKRNITNGLDCSGFVSWALLNGGFDVKDVGAGWSNNRDLTDYGTVKKLTKTLAKSNTIKVGDLLHSNAAGGHIGIIVGIDDNNYYIAQALWYKTIGVVITKYKKDKLPSSFPHVVLMDKYYKEDGKLTNMW